MFTSTYQLAKSLHAKYVFKQVKDRTFFSGHNVADVVVVVVGGGGGGVVVVDDP